MTVPFLRDSTILPFAVRSGSGRALSPSASRPSFSPASSPPAVTAPRSAGTARAARSRCAPGPGGRTLLRSHSNSGVLSHPGLILQDNPARHDYNLDSVVDAFIKSAIGLQVCLNHPNSCIFGWSCVLLVFSLCKSP